ncbi:MAG: methylenetetrahydrofolate reductase, partial [Firmicutes bacterium]|nr:methylenetetrahydrofolate reductase [Bacillota bacterium]
CVAAGRAEVDELCAGLREDGVENILALRGDQNPDWPSRTDFSHADELIAYLRRRTDSGISAACYPEGHPESPDLVSDIRYLKQKVDAGAEHLISQLFFDNEDFFRFLERCRIAGINVPIEAGIMPVLNKRSIERMVSVCGASLPRKLTRILARYGDHPEALREAGLAYAIDQIADLVAGGVDGIHLYTMNNPEIARQIADSLSFIRKV